MYYLSMPLTIVLYVFVITFFITSIFKIENLKWRREVSVRTQSITILLGRFFCVIVVLFLVWTSIPFLKDSFRLVTGQYIVVEGYVQDLNHKSKDLNEYVVLSGVKISFLFDSQLEIGKKYRIKYLPNTQTGINSIEIK
ncbi:hypothetical protein [Paenibacillus terrigena]|uniref:hypothetical protein n=1 Tax=Paenibacillus terrigena TaxID=369333 RepID=UPI0012EB3AB0|nr:hypothetical protein [Paenibacillus terrigena]